jgi:hypothetical protein
MYLKSLSVMNINIKAKVLDFYVVFIEVSLPTHGTVAPNVILRWT